MKTLSVVINTINEEKNLPKTLASVKNLHPEIVVVDMRSDDATVEIAKKAGAKVYQHERTNYVEPARNFAISKASGEWILILDADEELPKSLRIKIKKIIENPDAQYFRIPRKNIIFGKWIKHSRWWPDFNIRLFKKGHVTWNEVIHSVPMTQGTGADLESKEQFAIKHNHIESIEQFVMRMNRYTTEHSKVLVKEGYKFNWTDLIIKPSNEFLSRYFFGEGYKDGLHGLALAGLQGFSEFVLYLKVWQSDKFQAMEVPVSAVIRTLKKAESDFHYWEADSLVKTRGGLVNKLRRKFKV